MKSGWICQEIQEVTAAAIIFKRHEKTVGEEGVETGAVGDDKTTSDIIYIEDALGETDTQRTASDDDQPGQSHETRN